MLSCKEVSRLVSDSLDRKLPWQQRLAVRVHLLMCCLCSRFQRQLLLLRDAVRHHRTIIEQSEAVPDSTLPRKPVNASSAYSGVAPRDSCP